MVGRDSASQLGISSAGLYHVYEYGRRLRRLFVRGIAVGRLLVGSPRKEIASSVMRSDHAGACGHVLAGSVSSSFGLCSLSGFFSTVDSDLNGRGHQLACPT